MIAEVITTLIFASIMWLLGFADGYVRGTRETIKEIKKNMGAKNETRTN